jgi:hypothetical protein
MDETWFYHYDPETKNQWSGGIEAQTRPKNSSAKNSLEKFWPRFFGYKMAFFVRHGGYRYRRDLVGRTTF